MDNMYQNVIYKICVIYKEVGCIRCKVRYIQCWQFVSKPAKIAIKPV